VGPARLSRTLNLKQFPQYQAATLAYLDRGRRVLVLDTCRDQAGLGWSLIEVSDHQLGWVPTAGLLPASSDSDLLVAV
jgi:hypothetical protein